jgi:hypothetical protein
VSASVPSQSKRSASWSCNGHTGGLGMDGPGGLAVTR